MTDPLCPRVAGQCPMGCGSTLFLGAAGHVTCSFIDCPNPSAADGILGTTETEHVVQFNQDGFSIQHPLRERLGQPDDALWECPLHAHIQGMNGPPVAPGRYRATAQPEALTPWSWTAL